MPTQQDNHSAHRKLSIALVCHSYPPVIGGSEIEAQRVCAALMRRGHRADVFCAGGPPMPDLDRWVDPVGVPVHLFGRRLPPRLRDYAYSLGVAWQLFWRRREYDVVYFLMSGLHIATAMPAMRLRGMPMVMKFSGSNTIRQMQGSGLGRLEMRMIRDWAARIMILNDGMAEEAREAQVDARKLLWMPNPVDTDEFCPVTGAQRSNLRSALGISPRAPAIVFVGRLAPEKELSSLIEAMKAIRQDIPDAHLVLVGDGPSRPLLEQQVREADLQSQVKFTGMVPVTEVRKWMQCADVFTLVSSLEGLPCALIEAMSAGIPSVVSDIPANLQLVDHGEQGMVARLKDSGSIAAGLSTLLKDPELRARLGRNARARVIETYSTAAVVARYELLFSELLNTPRAELCAP